MASWFRLSLFLITGAVCTAGACGADAQAAYTATRSVRLQAGAGVLLLNNDYTSQYNKGLTVYGDVDFKRLLGIEAVAHLGGLVTPDDIGENSYEVGPRVLYHRGKLAFYGKLMAGRASITNQRFADNTSSYNLYAFGGGAEYLATSRWNLRADVEDQKWPNFSPHSLSPMATTLGLAYVFK